MENREVLRIILLLLVFLAIPLHTFAYSIDTHSFLTDETVRFYNKEFSNPPAGGQISDNERDFLIDGSRHEESFPRPLNHFYDPVNSRGLETPVKDGYPSPTWAVDSEKQNEGKYKITTAVASILTAIKEKRISALSTETNFTWERAKRFYLKGEKAKAMYLLGHTLHLIQDVSVPAKTRNDFILKSDERSYKSWAEKFTLKTRDFTLPRRLESKEPFELNDLKSYFNKLALYTNNNFFSKNTIGIQSYGQPTSDILEKDQGYYYRFGYEKGFGKYHLVLEENPGNHNYLVNFKKNLSLDDKHKAIFRDYWSLLSTKAVQHGAGVIDLFFREIEKIKEDPAKLAQVLGKKEEKSFLGKVVDVVKKTFNSSGDFDESEEISLSEQPESKKLSGDKKELETCSFSEGESPSHKTLIINEVAWMGDNDNFRHEWIELKNISEKEIDIGGYQVVDKKEQIQFSIPQGTAISPGSFYLMERNDESSASPSADSIYEGALSNSNEGLKVFSYNCKLMDKITADPDWPAGDNDTKQTMERTSDLSWHDSSESGGTPKAENSIVEPELEPTISVDKKELKPGEVIYETGTGFTPENTAVLHFILPDGKEVTDSMTTDEDGFFEKMYTMPAEALLGEYTYYAVDEKTGIESNKINYSVVEESQLPEEKEVSEEKESESEQENISYQSCNYETDDSPNRSNLIINEIAWMGDNDNWRNEWIELKNISESDLDLAGYQLIDKDDQTYVTFSTTTVSAGGFVLLERNNDDSALNKTADIVYTGSLKNSDEGLRLFDDDCNLLDEAIADPDWPEGNNDSKKTMERKDNLEWQTSDNVGGTPREENSTVRIYHSGGGGGGSSSNNDSSDDDSGNDDSDDNEEVSYSEVLISEIQTKGETVRDEFIELYNTSTSSVDLTDWSLERKTSGGSKSNLVSSLSGIVPAQGYFLIVPQFSSSTSNYTSSTSPDIHYSISTCPVASDNTVLLYKPNDELSDKVGFGKAKDYETATTTNPKDEQSISRKSEVDTDNNSNDFIVTIPSPKNSETSGGFIIPEEWTEETEEENNLPTALFSYSPKFPEVGEQVIFNASSSTDDNGIVSYEWNFGDGNSTSSFIATTTHTYSSSGNYTVSLTVFDSENSSSTATTSISITSAAVSGTEADHIVISEILFDAEGSDGGKEFVELYYNTDEETVRDLSGWKLIFSRGNSTSTESLAHFGSEKGDETEIKSNSFFLVGFSNFTSSAFGIEPDIVRSASLLNGNEDITVFLLDDANDVVDSITYNKDSINSAGESLERKAFDDGSCHPAQVNYEFKGNSCEGLNSFSIRDNPNPQNSSSLPEPRRAPTSTEDFSATYNPDNLTISFNWGAYKDSNEATSTVSYKIKEYSSLGEVIYNSTSTGYSKEIKEVGRDYAFSFQAFDKDGLGSAITTSTVSDIPSFLDNFFVYKRNSTSSKYLAEFYYPKYPFVPDKYKGTRKGVAVYLNREAPSVNDLTLFNGWNFSEEDEPLHFIFDNCNRGRDSIGPMPVFPDGSGDCTGNSELYGEMVNYDWHGLGEDNHVLLKLASSTLELEQSDYFTFAFYGYNKIGTFGGPPFSFIAVDKTKYTSGREPAHASPVLRKVITGFDDKSSNLTVNWEQATDPDTIDSQLTYEIDYTASSTELNPDLWEDIGSNVSNKKTVVPEDNFLIGVRAKDDFGNYSNVATTTWKYLESSVIFNQKETDSWTDDGDIWGTVDNSAFNADTASFQSLKFSESISFNKAAVKLKQLDTIHKYAADIRLSVLNSSSSSPDFQSVIAEPVKNNVLNPDKDLIFSFDNSINFQAGKEYWLVLDVAGPQDAFFDDEWTNAVKTGSDAYSNGKAGKGRYKGQNSSCSEIANDKDQCAFNGNYDLGPADWYLELRLE